MVFRLLGVKGLNDVPLHMHTWAPVPRAHAHLGAGAPRACTLGRQCPMRMHTGEGFRVYGLGLRVLGSMSDSSISRIKPETLKTRNPKSLNP